FQEEAAVELRRSVAGIDDAAIALMEQHAWPGNVRELRNVIRQAVLQAESPTIQPADVERLLGKGAARAAPMGRATGPVPAGRAPTTCADGEELWGKGAARAGPMGMATVPVPAGASLKDIAEAAADAAEKQAILETLRITKGNKSQAARQLKVDFKTLHAKM